MAGSVADLIIAVNAQRAEAKAQHHRAMDAVVDLLLERGELRAILRAALDGRPGWREDAEDLLSEGDW